MPRPVTLKALVSDSETLLAMPREELAFTLLQVLHDPENRQFCNKYNTLRLYNIVEGYPRSSWDNIMESLSHAWNWLEAEGLIVPRTNAEEHAYRVTDLGMRISSMQDMNGYIAEKEQDHSHRRATTPQIATNAISDGGTQSATRYEYEVALSFAGEQRDFVRKVALRLREMGVNVFFDEFEQVNLWGSDLGDRLEHVYRSEAHYTVMFISKEYAAKEWTNHERRSALARRILTDVNAVLPVRFDGTELPGLSPTVSYLSIHDETPESLAEKIQLKIKTTDSVIAATEDAISEPSPDEKTLEAPTIKYLAFGTSEKEVGELFQMFGDAQPTAQSSGEFVDVYLDDWTETQSVFGAVRAAQEAAQAASERNDGSDPGAIFLETIGEEVIQRATAYMFADHKDGAPGGERLPGVDYMIVGVRSDIAKIIQLLRVDQMISGPKPETRNATEIFFEDLESAREAFAALNRVRQQAKNNKEFLQLAFSEAMRLKLKKSVRGMGSS